MRYFYSLTLLIGIIFVSSCVSDDDSVAEATLITISADTTMVEAGNTITFTVKTDEGDNVTPSSTITANNKVIDGNTFTANKAGTYVIKATYKNLISKTHYEVVVIDRKPTAIELTTPETVLPKEEIFTFTVMTDVNTDVTFESLIEVDGETLEREKFIPEKAGIYTVTATYNELTSSPLEIEVLPDSISVVPDTTEIQLGETFTFTVLGDAEIDITSGATIEVNGAPIEGNAFKPTKTGVYMITASYMEIVSEPVYIAVLAGEGNFFTLGGTNYETPTGTFAYAGTFEGDHGLESIWAFNPFLEIDNGDGTFDYPNDLYLYFAVAQTHPTDLIFPSEGVYILQADALPATRDAQVYYEGNEWVNPEDTFENIVLYIKDMDEWSEGTSSAQQIVYTITKTDGTTVTGQYSGPLFVWDASGRTPEKVSGKPVQLNRPETISRIR